MTDCKHTPGPWRISRTSGMRIFINHDHDQPNRVPGYFAEVRRFTTDNGQVEANAMLIASAPDLLDALQLIASAKDRDFGIDYAVGCAEAAISDWRKVMMTEYVLPPLPEPAWLDGEPYWCDRHMEAYARTAIAPYQQRIAELESQLEAIGAGGVSSQRITSQRRGEPVARVNDDGFIVETGLGLAPGTLLYTAPQPAEPVKVPSDDERSAQGLPPYSPRHLTEEEWNRLTESGRRAWGKQPAMPTNKHSLSVDEPEKEPPCET